jgi:hypothetical protein
VRRNRCLRSWDPFAAGAMRLEFSGPLSSKIRFPAKLSKNGAENSKRLVGTAWRSTGRS